MTGSSERLAWVDLRAVEDARWRSARLPGSTHDVGLVRLHRDEATGASVSLARFPAGWTRDEAGCFPAAEEMAVLDGALELSGVELVAGEYGFVPPRVVRTASSSPRGALVLAWFSGPAPWSTDEGERVAGEVTCRPLAPGALRPVARDVAGSCSFVEASSVASVDRDLFDPSHGRWCLVPARRSAPASTGAVQQRAWS